MAAPKQNQFWKARSSHGPNPKFKTPEDLLSACEEYFQWVDDNPLWEAKLVSYQGESKIEYVDKLRVMTLGSLCLFLGINISTWWRWRNDRDDLRKVIDMVEQAITEQKYAGAAADLLNANIISRDLGLADRLQHSGPDGGPIQTEEVSKIDRAKAVAFLLREGAEEVGDVD